MRSIALIGFLIMFSPFVKAQDAVFQASIQAPLDKVYSSVNSALEENRFFVVFEANMGRNMARFAERWGEDYNRNALEGIRSMVVCNIWYTNQIGNTDPSMLSLCPLTVTLIHKVGTTTVLFARPTAIAKGSDSESVFRELEQELIAAIRQGLR
ncbi:MAG: DUF302 domain-containing protein [Gammaproteobacteria bacterium]|nr:DUF302 domain-containing protein [Gammaproteobacteria bacterium]